MKPDKNDDCRTADGDVDSIHQSLKKYSDSVNKKIGPILDQLRD